MKTALITTTIHPPEALYLLRKYGPDVGMFVAIEKDSDPAISDMCYKVGAMSLVGDWYRCSALIGSNCVQRRNVALLAALEWGADIIVSWDTDNLPLTRNFFVDFEDVLSRPFSGLCADTSDAWFDVGKFLQPPVRQRGIPFAQQHLPVMHLVDSAQIGVAQGTVIGYPDIDSVGRIENNPVCYGVSDILRSGVVFAPALRRWTMWNTQCVAFTRELAPAMFCPPASAVGRHDDMIAALVTQRVMRETGHIAHFGLPFVWHEHPRTTEQMVRNLAGEWWGYENIERVADYLDEIQFSPTADMPVADAVRNIYIGLKHKEWFPPRAAEAALAFCDDVEEILRA